MNRPSLRSEGSYPVFQKSSMMGYISEAFYLEYKQLITVTIQNLAGNENLKHFM